MVFETPSLLKNQSKPLVLAWSLGGGFLPSPVWRAPGEVNSRCGWARAPGARVPLAAGPAPNVGSRLLWLRSLSFRAGVLGRGIPSLWDRLSLSASCFVFLWNTLTTGHGITYMLASGLMVARAERSPVFPSPRPTGRAQDMATAPSASPGSHTLLVPFLLPKLLPDPSSLACAQPLPRALVSQWRRWAPGRSPHMACQRHALPRELVRSPRGLAAARAGIYQAPSRCKALLGGAAVLSARAGA